MAKTLGDSSSTISSTDPTLYSSSPASTVASTGIIKKSAATATETETDPAMKKTVTFQNVEVAQHPMILGDNPSADGLPLSIGWECDFKSVFQLDEYETLKPEPRSRQQFWMPPQYREEILRRLEVTASEMLRTTTEMKRIRNSRSRSIRNQKWDKLFFFVEESKNRLKRIASGTSLSKSPSSSSLLSGDQLEHSSSSVSSAIRKRMPKFKWRSSDGDNIDPLDESTKSRIALHLLQHPEELMEEIDSNELSGDLSIDADDELIPSSVNIQAVEDTDGNPLYNRSIPF